MVTDEISLLGSALVQNVVDIVHGGLLIIKRSQHLPIRIEEVYDAVKI